MGNPSKTRTPLKYTDALVGGDILSLITCGMYDNPLTIYREYIQNSADSISSSDQPENGKVEIEIDIVGMRVTIRDNGPGMSYQRAKQELVPIAKSRKSRQHNRGFRGIGRLSGLAFAGSVKFLTRCNQNTPVTQVVWNAKPLRNEENSKLPAEEVILQCVSIEKLDGNSYPNNFFEVQIEGLSRYAAASILNRDAVRRYLGEVSPVQFSLDFPYNSQASRLFNENKPFILDIHLDGEEEPITKLHKGELHFSKDRSDKFREFEEVKIPALDGKNYAAMGWIAHYSYLGALPPKLGVRCLRARVGNIQIGNETVFDHLFSESRFNRWCVAEIHILDPRIVPNGRRDYFEPSVHLRNLENHLGAVCRELENRCRIASRERSQQRNIQTFLENLEATYDLAISGYLTAGAANELRAEKLEKIADFRKKHKDLSHSEDFRKLDQLTEKLTEFREVNGMPFPAGIDSSDVSTYRKIFKILAEISPSPQDAKETIENILRHEAE